MPKIKTKKGAAKRFSYTSSGKIKRNAARRTHILTKMSRKRKRNLRQAHYVEASSRKQVRRLVPYR